VKLPVRPGVAIALPQEPTLQLVRSRVPQLALWFRCFRLHRPYAARTRQKPEKPWALPVGARGAGWRSSRRTAPPVHRSMIVYFNGNLATDQASLHGPPWRARPVGSSQCLAIVSRRVGRDEFGDAHGSSSRGRAFQTQAIEWMQPDARRWLSGLNARVWSPAVWPRSTMLVRPPRPTHKARPIPQTCIAAIGQREAIAIGVERQSPDPGAG
jgi:hypothetical protein